MQIDAFIIGSAKCATKWLAEALRQSGSVSIPGESQGLTQFADADASYYNGFFAREESEGASITVDYSNTYMLDSSLPQKIKDTFGVRPIIFSFRNPVDRAFSHYLMDATYGYYDLKEPGGFREALLNPRTFSFFDFGLYEKRLLPFLEVFGERNVLVIDADAIGESPMLTRTALEFLSVTAPEARAPETPLNTFEQFRAGHLGPEAVPAERPVMSAEDRRWLEDCYADEHARFLRLVASLPHVVRV